MAEELAQIENNSESKGKVLLLKLMGILFVGLGIIGALLPIIPTTPFLLVAAACFAKSSPKLQEKLLANKTFGPLITAWHKDHSIPKKVKIFALISMVLSIFWAMFLFKSVLPVVIYLAVMIIPFVYVARLPESK